jgi:peptidoglycan/LPS O-acetylase OafA/YrhL
MNKKCGIGQPIWSRPLHQGILANEAPASVYRVASMDRLQSMHLMGLPTLPATRYIPTLDGWRALSILIVALSHAGLGQWIPGNMGVSIFFFLSGFLIMTLTIQECQGEHGFQAGRFYIRRAIRLYPPLLAALVLAYGLLALDVIPGGLTWQGLSAQLFYLSNYQYLFWHTPHDVPSGTGILWSLAVEEHFYMVLPVLIWSLQRSKQLHRLGVILVMLTLVALAWRVYLNSQGASSERIYYATDTRFDSILYGALLAVFWNPLQAASSQRLTPAAMLGVAGGGLVLLFCVAYRDADFRDTLRYSLIGLALIPLFHCSVKFHASSLFKWMENAVLRKIGAWSYAIYLSHLVLIEACTHLGSHPIVNHGVALSASLLFAYLCERYVDAPTKGLRAKFR